MCFGNLFFSSSSVVCVCAWVGFNFCLTSSWFRQCAGNPHKKWNQNLVLCIRVTQISLRKLMLKSYKCRLGARTICSLKTIRTVDIYFCIISKMCEAGGLEMVVVVAVQPNIITSTSISIIWTKPPFSSASNRMAWHHFAFCSLFVKRKFNVLLGIW